MDDAAATPTHSEPPPGVRRRDLIKGGALVTGATGAAWVSPLIYDSVTNPAAAAGCGSSDLPQTFATPGDYTVYVAANTPVYYDVRGGGGGSGGWASQNGGAGAKLTGTVLSSATAYVLTINVGGGGGAGAQSSSALGGAGGTSGYAVGGKGADLPTGRGRGSGAGGGGSSAVFNTSKGIAVVAPGGGGSAGGCFDGTAGGGTGANRKGGGGGAIITGSTSSALAGEPGGNGSFDGLANGAVMRGEGGSGAGAGSGGSGGAGGTGGTDGSPGSVSGGAGANAVGKPGAAGGTPADLPNVASGGGGGGGYFGGGGGGGSTSQSTSKGASGGGGGSGAAYVSGAGTATIGSGGTAGAGVDNAATGGVGGGAGSRGGHGSVTLSCEPISQGPQTLPSTFSALSTPTYTNDTDQQVVLTGRIQPAAAGRSVTLRRRNPDSTTTNVGSTTADAAGNFSFTTEVLVVTDFEYHSPQQLNGQNTYQAATSTDFEVRSLRLYDDFNYTNVAQMQPKWKLRGSQVYQDAGKFYYSKADWDAITFNSTGLVFGIVADGTDPNGKQRFKVPQITAGKLDGLVYGHLEARIKFERPRGAHGALWWQCGYGPGGGEFDVVEWFGRRSPGGPHTQNVQHTIHSPTGGTDQRFGSTWTDESEPLGPDPGTQTVFTQTNWPGSYDTWWNEYHTYGGFWSSDKYYFYIDDVLVGSIGPANGVTPASIPGDVILNMAIVEPHEYDDLVAHLAGSGTLNDFKMHVDWIRVWK